MDPKKNKKKSNSTAGVITVILLAGIGLGTYGYKKAHKAVETGKGEVQTSRGLLGTYLDTYKDAWVSANNKAAEIQGALEENEKLKNENANLRLKLETAQFNLAAKDAAYATVQNTGKLKKESGSKVARTLASIEYKVPTNLLPSQLYTLGMTYFKADENEKAAVIFSFLTGLEDNAAYRTARNYSMSAVAWYRVNNYELADHYFDLVLKQPDQGDNLRYQAQARLWKGILANHAGKQVETQYWLKDLLDHHPLSTEAAWINKREAEREPASKE